MATQSQAAREIFERVIPFRFLPAEQLDSLAGAARLTSFDVGQTIIEQGDTSDRSVYVLASGRAEIFDLRTGVERTVMFVEPDHFFGEWEPLFEMPRFYGVRAAEQSQCVVLDGDHFLHLIRDVRAFAHSLGTVLRDQHGIFAAFERFKIELMRSITKGYITLPQLLPLYRALEPAMHPLVGSDTIDVTALSYVIRRLPQNVTRSFAYVLTDEIPAVYQDPDGLFPKVPTEARRRDVWETLPGGSMVLLRNGLSDLVDLLSCLCLYAVEAAKIRARLHDPQSVRVLKNWANGRITNSRAAADLPFSRAEFTGMSKLWGSELASRLFEIVKHRETFAITVRRHSEKYNSHRTELWTQQLAAACAQLLGAAPADLPTDLPVHIVSSNTHSVTNCLNSWYSDNRDDVLSWGKRSGHALMESAWKDPYDLVYGLARDYFLAHPSARESVARAERDQGILRLKETASTGIQVQLIETGRVCAGAIDPGISLEGPGDCGESGTSSATSLIVNIDYAFGQQAEHILLNLLLLFGLRVRSVSLLGKAGALIGRRGDILVPTGFLEQSADAYYAMPARFTDSLQDHATKLQRALPEAAVHSGPMLTVDGTLLQNSVMLRYYREIWRCIGMEMEGAYYFRQFQEAQNIGIIRPDADVGLYYYISDVPLKADASLAARLHPSEGIPPLYAITRHVLSSIL